MAVEASSLHPRHNRWQALLIVAILLLGFGLRVYALDGQSLWSDEGISLIRSKRTFSLMLETMPVEQMPGYFVLLHGWLPLVGEEDYAVRFLSLLPSVLVIALTYRLASALGSRRSGILAAILVATNPFQIWYAQEARGYSWLLGVGLLSTWLFWCLVTARRRAGFRYICTLLGYSLATAGVVYLHFYGALVPLAHCVFSVGWTAYQRDWQFSRHWVGGGLISLLLFLPWVPRLPTILDFPGWRAPIDPWQMPWQVLTFYSVGGSLPAPWLAWLPWVYLALLALGTVGWWRVGGRSLLFVLTCLLVPLGITFAIVLKTLDFHERYTIVATVPLLLLFAGGLAVVPVPSRPVDRLGRVARWAGQGAGLALLLLLLAGNRAALQEYYTNEAFQKPDFRAAVRMIERYGQDGDTVILDGPDPNLVFLHYYQAPFPVHDMRPYLKTSYEEVAAAMAEKTAGAKRVWEVLFFHEPWAVQQWLGYYSWSSPAADHNGIRVTLYGLDERTMVSTTADLPVGDALLLETTALSTSPIHPGDLLQVTTQWQVLQPLPDYKFSLRLLDGAGQVVMAQDYVPQNWFFPTPQWPVGETIADRRGFLLPFDFPPGPYQVTLRLYDPSTGVVAETAAGQDIVIGAVEVEPVK
ncbi:MAG: glycosyltransferase family 39 protein [Caldilineaceae bacterium]